MLIFLMVFLGFWSHQISNFLYAKFPAVLDSVSLGISPFSVIAHKLLRLAEIISSEAFRSLFCNLLSSIQSVLFSAQINER